MKNLASTLTAALIAATNVHAECGNALPVKGVISVDICNAKEEACISSDAAVKQYLEAEDDSSTYSFGLHSSPWHLYDPERRIVRVETISDMIRPKLTPKHKAVLLIASWTGVAPDSSTPSLAKQLSDKLDGFPVQGQDGFVWLSKQGAIRTTHQALTMYQGVYTHIHEGEDVFVSMTQSWYLLLEDQFVKQKDGKGLLRSAAAWEIFGLCPERALDRFEAAAKFGNPIAAYNAALIRLAKKNPTDSTTARSLLRSSAKLGDRPSIELLEELDHGAHSRSVRDGKL